MADASTPEIRKANMLKAALSYALKGWYVFPLHTLDDTGNCTCGKVPCSDAGKHPRVFRWKEMASIDPIQITEWFGEGSEPSNVAIVTGEVSGITVIDVDIGLGKHGADTWREITKENGEPITLMAETGSGGMHVFFQYNSAFKTSANTLGMGVDCRNDGGYIVAPPSKHRSRGYYRWINAGQEIANIPHYMTQRKEFRGRKKSNEAMFKGKYSLEQVQEMLKNIPSDDRDAWRNFGVILGRVFDRSDAAWQIYSEWSDKWSGAKGRNHDEIMREAFYEISQIDTDKPLTIGSIVKAAIDNGWVPKKGEVPVGSFVYFGPGNNYIYRPTSSYWIAPAVDCAVSPVNESGTIVKASEWLRSNALCTSMTNDPLIDDDYVKGFDCRDGEIIASPGAALYNTYRKPTIELGDHRLAQPFVEHCRIIFNKPGDCDQFLDYMAHRVQKPAEKPRFALLIAGGQGVGKDTAIEFCCPALGHWNVANIEPSAFENAFNEYAAATLVRISEAANLHEMNRWAFNERLKVLIAGSPDYCTINQKYGQKYSVRMHCGVIITTNHLASGIYIPADDRRYDVIEAATMEEMNLGDIDKRREYFQELWDWFKNGGAAHVAAFLHARDISAFSASNGQRKTAAHADVIATGLSTDQWLDDILDDLDWPDVVRSDIVLNMAVANDEKEADVKRKMGNAFGRLGYMFFRNQGAKDGRWKADGMKFTIYAKVGTPREFDVLSHLRNAVPMF